MCGHCIGIILDYGNYNRYHKILNIPLFLILSWVSRVRKKVEKGRDGQVQM